MREWAEQVRQREPWTLAGPDMIRYGLKAGESHLYFIRAEHADETDDETDETEEDSPRARDDDRSIPDVTLSPEPVRRVLCRVPLVAAHEDEAEEVEVEEIAELGAYPLGYELLDGGERVVLVYEPRRDDKDVEEPPVPEEEARANKRILRLGEHTHEGWRWRDLYTGGPQLVLAGALELRNEVLLVEPGEERFENRILRLSLEQTEEGAEPYEWTTGLYPACADEYERYLVVTRVGENPRVEGFRRGPVQRPDQIDEDARLRYPPSVFTVSLSDPDDERRLVARQDFVHVRFVHDDIAYADVVERFPSGRNQHPVLQGVHSLAYFDLGDDETPTRVPMSEESNFDFQLVAPLSERGILYLRNTNVNRHLYLFTGDMRTVRLHTLSPLTAEFVAGPQRRTLYYLQYTAEARPPFNPKTQPTRLLALDLHEE